MTAMAITTTSRLTSTEEFLDANRHEPLIEGTYFYVVQPTPDGPSYREYVFLGVDHTAETPAIRAIDMSTHEAELVLLDEVFLANNGVISLSMADAWVALLDLGD